MNAVFLDIETTGRNPHRHQIYEFAAVPVMNTVIRRDLMYHVYLTHKTYKIETDILLHAATRIANPKPGVPVIPANAWGHQFKDKIREWFGGEKKIVLGGKNIGGFDVQFMKALDGSLNLPSDLFSYSYIDVGNFYVDPGDKKLPSLEECGKRAKLDGAPISHPNSHYADDDALLAAELFVWHMYDRILYGEVSGDILRVYTPKVEHDGGLSEEGDSSPR